METTIELLGATKTQARICASARGLTRVILLGHLIGETQYVVQPCTHSRSSRMLDHDGHISVRLHKMVYWCVLMQSHLDISR